MTNEAQGALDNINELSMDDVEQAAKAPEPAVRAEGYSSLRPAEEALPEEGISSVLIASLILGSVALVVVLIVLATWTFEGDKRVTAVKSRPSEHPTPPIVVPDPPAPPSSQAGVVGQSGFVSPKYVKYGKSPSGLNGSAVVPAVDVASASSGARSATKECVVVATADIRAALQGCLNQDNPTGTTQ